MPARTGTLGDLLCYGLQRRLAEPVFVLTGSDVNRYEKLPIPIVAVKCPHGRQIAAQCALAIFQIGYRRVVLNLERSPVNHILSSTKISFKFVELLMKNEISKEKKLFSPLIRIFCLRT